ncbi:MAG: hypothetical protein WBP26_03275 [Candidatus Saccharimonadales bacterium]
MSNYRIRPQDRIKGELLAAGSTAGHIFPVLGDKIGRSDHPGFAPLRWRFMRGTPASRYEPWIICGGNDDAGYTPANYPEVAILRFHRRGMDSQVRAYRGRQAVAYVLGTSAVMAGTSESAVFGVDPEDENLYTAGMRIGKGVLKALPGIVVSERGATPGIFIRFPVLAGVGAEAAVDRMPLEQVPAGIPIH